MIFWQKKQINSDEYEKLTKKIIELNANYESLIKRVDLIVTDIANLRGRFNQKLSRIKEEEKTEESKEEEGINKPVLLSVDGHIIKN